MDTKVFQSQGTQARLEMGPFSPFLDDYVSELKRVGYAERHFAKAFRVIIRFSDWVGLKRIDLNNLNQLRIEEFWKYHGELRKHCDFRVLGEFICFLRNRKAIPQVPIPKVVCPIEKQIYIFEKYLRDERGLSSTYIYQLTRTARIFLEETFPSVNRRFDGYTAKVISDYFLGLLKIKLKLEIKDTSRYLSQFFKFLFINDQMKINLSKAVPRPANWRHTRLPIYIGPEKVKMILDSCDRKTQIGARDYAVLVLLSRLGLRGCEVKNLNLEDLHWREGAMTVRGKGKESKMPMPKEVGKAITSYVKNFRPKTPSRSLFVSVFPPHQGFKRTCSVSGVVSFALDRAKIKSLYKGAYLLRHTVANECLKNGASLREVGQLLRHENLGTTTIYAKVDFKRLAQVARPWNGGAQ